MSGGGGGSGYFNPEYVTGAKLLRGVDRTPANTYFGTAGLGGEDNGQSGQDGFVRLTVDGTEYSYTTSAAHVFTCSASNADNGMAKQGGGTISDLEIYGSSFSDAEVESLRWSKEAPVQQTESQTVACAVAYGYKLVFYAAAPRGTGHVQVDDISILDVNGASVVPVFSGDSGVRPLAVESLPECATCTRGSNGHDVDRIGPVAGCTVTQDVQENNADDQSVTKAWNGNRNSNDGVWKTNGADFATQILCDHPLEDAALIRVQFWSNDAHQTGAVPLTCLTSSSRLRILYFVLMMRV
jgi:hypothetical protein